MESVKYVKAEDRLGAEDSGEAQRGLDCSSLLGAWVNTNSATRGIVKVVLTTKKDALTVHAFGVCDPTPCDWGEATVNVVYADSLGSQRAIAFTAKYDFGFMESHLQANVSMGLLIIASFHIFKDEGERPNLFCREFYHRLKTETDSSRGSTSSETDSSQSESGTRRAVDPTPFHGVWVNTNEATRGIARVDLRTWKEAFTVRAFGADDSALADWGEVEAALLADTGGAHGGTTFLTFYDFGFMEVYLHAWVKLGVLVIAKFDRFKDGSRRSNRFSREFFYRSETVGVLD